MGVLFTGREGGDYPGGLLACTPSPVWGPTPYQAACGYNVLAASFARFAVAE